MAPATGSNIRRRAVKNIVGFFKEHWIGTVVILIATIIFFWPIIARIDTYNPGGDAMFNAWTLARDQHCILRENCSNYANGNIFYPNNDSMLYSESQLSAGLLTMPFYFINQNPNFSYNVWTIVSFFLCGWFMYLLAKFLSLKNEFYSVLAGLSFAFGPIILDELDHLQNLSIFYLPLIVLLILKYFKTPARKYLIGLFIALVLMFYASWYQMVFAIVAILLLLLGARLMKLIKWQRAGPIALTVLLAIITTLPLAVQYVHLSHQTGVTYGAGAQVEYGSSVEDYLIPYNGTLFGNLYYKIRPLAKINSFSPDGDAYSGYALYLTAGALLVYSFIKRKKSKQWSAIYKLVVVFSLIALAGFVISLGPLLKIGASYLHKVPGSGGKLTFAVALPYLAVDMLLPQLNFIRAIDRASILVLFAFCCILALVPIALATAKIKKRLKYTISAVLFIFIFVEFCPIHRVVMTGNPYYYNMAVPKAYKLIKSDPAINDIVVLAPDNNYPGQTFLPKPFLNGVFEQVLWAGYDNKNTFNGYSGYTPKSYNKEMSEFNNFQSSDIPIMQSLGIRYILVDKLLSSSEPTLVSKVSSADTSVIYQGTRYVLFKIQ